MSELRVPFEMRQFRNPVLVILGLPLCGKTVQSELITSSFRIPRMSTGAIFRAAIAQDTELGNRIKKIVEGGQLVPDHIVLRTVDSALQGLELKNGFLLDGFPRTISQAEFLDQTLRSKGIRLDQVIVLDVTEEEILRRLENRWKTQGRRDDGSELAIRVRIESYKSQTIPVISHYEQQGVANRVNGNQTIDEVFHEIHESLDGRSNPPRNG